MAVRQPFHCKGWSLIIMSHVEVFVTVIKIESSESKPFLRANQVIKVTSEL